MNPTLLLNADGMPISYIPLSSITWQESIKLYYLNRADILVNHDFSVHSPSIEIKVPAVIMLRDFIKVAKSVIFNKMNVFIRDEYKCQYCGYSGYDNQYTLTKDHYIPRTKGGKTNWANILTACYSCNLEKGDRTDIKPFKIPRRPSFYELIEKRKKFPINICHESWKEFLDIDDKLINFINPTI